VWGGGDEIRILTCNVCSVCGDAKSQAHMQAVCTAMYGMHALSVTLSLSTGLGHPSQDCTDFNFLTLTLLFRDLSPGCC
jgi:hypothetical protein